MLVVSYFQLIIYINEIIIKFQKLIKLKPIKRQKQKKITNDKKNKSNQLLLESLIKKVLVKCLNSGSGGGGGLKKKT